MYNRRDLNRQERIDNERETNEIERKIMRM
jgi:hypothetical protein